MKYYVKLKASNLLDIDMKEMILELELPTYEQRFPDGSFEEVYFSGSFRKCQNFIDSRPKAVRSQFKIEEAIHGK